MTFVIAPTDLVKGENQYPEFRNILPALQKSAIQEAKNKWSGFTFGGVRPNDDQFGLTSFLPRDVHGAGTLTFVKSYSDPGSWTNIFSYSVPEDEIHGLAGISIPQTNLIFSHLRFEIGDRKFPILNIEEARRFNGGFDVILKQDEQEELVLKEEESVLVRGLQERGTSGAEQRVIPIGFELVRRKDLVLTEDEPSA